MRHPLLSSLLVIFMGQAALAEPPELKTVEHVDLNRYLGHWYEIARYPAWFEKDCDRAKAHYSLLPDDTIEVLNTCLRKKDGKVVGNKGLAIVEKNSGNTKLKVNFLPSWLRWTSIGTGNYWIIALDDNYQYAVVSEPQRSYLWVLSRSPKIDPAKWQIISTFLEKNFFDTSKLIFSFGKEAIQP